MGALKGSTTSTQGLILLVGVWIVTLGNLVLWGHVAPQVGILTLLAFAMAWLGVWFSLMQWLSWPWLLKGVLISAVLVSAVTSYYMLTYGVVIDPSMMRNALATDTHEVLDLLSWQLAVAVAVMCVPAVWVIARWRIEWDWTWRATGGRLMWSVLAMAYALALLWASYADLSSLMRNDRAIRYQINPFNSVYSLVRALAPKLDHPSQALISVGDDVTPVQPSKQPPLLVLVVGETVRAANFGLAGYERNTTPHLQQRMTQGQLVYWSQAHSCGTNTDVSVPCMFSPLTAAEGANQPVRHQNLLDVLQKAGLGVYWVDNQSGCKGVCDRIPHYQINGRGDPRLCSQGECADEVLVPQLDRALASLSADQKQRGVVLVLHMMGSHGPAYFKRSVNDAKVFLPECSSNVLSECSPQALRNTYDNSIVYTDKVLSEVLEWLDRQNQQQAFAPAMMYVSDHGESLGEKGMYLHGAPRWMAPDEQTHIPLLAWYSPSFARERSLSVSCLQSGSGKPVQHDFVFHSVLGMMGVKTPSYRPQLDWHDPCLDRS